MIVINNIIGGFSCWPRFDPIAHFADVKAHPERYISLQRIAYEVEVFRQIKRCDTLAALESLFIEQRNAAKREGRMDFLKELIERKDKRKKELKA